MPSLITHVALKYYRIVYKQGLCRVNFWLYEKGKGKHRKVFLLYIVLLHSSLVICEKLNLVLETHFSRGHVDNIIHLRGSSKLLGLDNFYLRKFACIFLHN